MQWAKFVPVLTFAAAVIACAPVSGTVPPAHTTRVEITSGQLEGVRDDGLVIFKGVPYAASPVGPLRWRPPQPVSPWQGVRQAYSYGNDCMQNPFFGDSTPSVQRKSEDCLFLNIWAPDHPVKPLPVMFWIHGGGLTIGSSAAPLFDGAALAKKGVVVVTINYRLGRFGFFAHPALAAEDPGEPFGNYGLMDQIAALKWVHENIAAFDGDPDNVTIFGQSSGGVSVLHLMFAPEAKGLFAKAICESGGGREHWATLDHNSNDGVGAFAAGLNFARSVGIEGTGKAAAKALRALPAKTVLGDVGFLNSRSATYAGPMIDGRVAPMNTDKAFREGREVNIPLLIGTTDDELGNVPARFLSGMNGKVWPKFGARQNGLKAFYGAGKTRPEDLIDDAGFVEPARFIARSHAANGAPTWLYRFGYVAENKRQQGHGAHHTGELPYVFGTLKATGVDLSPADRRMIDTVQDYWVAFAKSGNPNHAGAPEWPAYSKYGGDLMFFTDNGAQAMPDPLKRRLNYIASGYPDPSK